MFVLAACFVFDIPESLTAEAVVMPVSTQEILVTQAAITGGTINIARDIALSQTIVVKKDLTIKSDGGFKITRSSSFEDTMFIVNNGVTLTLEGNLTIDGGAVWGGNVDSTLERGTTNSGVKASGVIIESNGSGNVTLNSGVTLQNNDTSASTGSAVLFNDSGTLNINGAVIRYNKAANAVIKTHLNSTVNMTAGEIYGNQSSRHGGAMQIYGCHPTNPSNTGSSKCNISGGYIHNNKASSVGGAIAVSDYGHLYLSGDVKITDNETTDYDKRGGGIGFIDKNTTLDVEGTVQITGNKAKGAANNIKVGTNSCNKIKLGALSSGANIGISYANTSSPFTQTNNTNYSSYFFSDDSNYGVEYKNSALYLYKSVTVTYDYGGATDGNSEASKTVRSGGTYGELPTPTKTGYTFSGWYTAASGGSKIESTTPVSNTSNHTIYARWTTCAHTWNTGTVTKQPTCTEEGSKTQTCTKCDATQTVPIDKKVHSYTYTANTSGDTITESCSNGCGHSATATLSLSPTSYTYTGSECKPTAKVTYSNTWAGDKPTPITVNYTNNTNAGTATAKITIEGKTATKDFTISPKALTDSMITISPSSYTYNGNSREPSVTVKDGTKSLTKGTDYTVSYSDNTIVGTAKVTVTGKGNYTGTITKTFQITAATLTGVSASDYTGTYDGTARGITVTIPDGATVTYGTSAENCTLTTSPTLTNVGEITVYYQVTKDNYDMVTGSATVKINEKSLTDEMVTVAPGTHEYNGTAIEPDITVTDGSTTLTSGTDYTVSYSNNINVGTATVTVIGKGNYTGTVNKEFTIIHTHTFSSDWSKDADYHWHAATCGHDVVDSKTAHSWCTGVTDSTTGNVTYTCSVCRATKTDTHTHTFATDWTTDDNYHWYAATCGHDVIDSKTAHTEDSGTVTLPPTETTEGTKTFKCSVCGYVMRTETLPSTGTEHVHDFGTEWKHDNINHWHECDCGNISENAPHTPSDWIVETPATINSEGVKIKKCTVCDTELERAAIEKLPDITGSGNVEEEVKDTAGTNSELIQDNTLINNTLTDEDKTEIENGSSFEIVLEVTDIKDRVPEKDAEAALTALNPDEKIGVYVDLSLFKIKDNNEADKTAIHETNKKVGITLTIPDSIYGADRTYSIIRVHDGNAENLGGTYDKASRKLTFYTDKFSTYAIAYTASNVETDNRPSKPSVPSTPSIPSTGGTTSVPPSEPAITPAVTEITDKKEDEVLYDEPYVEDVSAEAGIYKNEEEDNNSIHYILILIFAASGFLIIAAKKRFGNLDKKNKK